MIRRSISLCLLTLVMTNSAMAQTRMVSYQPHVSSASQMEASTASHIVHAQASDDLEARLAALEAQLEQNQGVNQVQFTEQAVVGPPIIQQQASSSFTAGVDLYFIAPTWSSNPAFYTGNGPTPATSPIQTGQDFDWGVTFSPAFWVETAGADGFGFRARYWNFEGDEQASFTTTAGATSAASPFSFGRNLGGAVNGGNTISASHDLEFHVIDAEFLQRTSIGRWDLEGAAGLRLLDIEQDYRISGIVGAAPASLRTVHDFKGIGPTLLAKASRNVFGNVSVFVSGRQSVLFGERDVASIATAGPPVRTTSTDGMLSITELELGLTTRMNWSRMGAFIELAFVGQHWTNVGNGVNGELYNASQDQDMGLVGGRGTVGFEW